MTLCTFLRKNLFGDVFKGEFITNEIGSIVVNELARTGRIRRELSIEIWVLMPNHLHMIVWLSQKGHGSQNRVAKTRQPSDLSQSGPHVGAHGRAPLGRASRSLGSFIAGFKSATTKKINRLNESPGKSVWQRNYYGHIIRDERDLARHRQYILENPLRWELDRYYSE